LQALSKKVKYLRDLTPDLGAYVKNEVRIHISVVSPLFLYPDFGRFEIVELMTSKADMNEPDWQHTFWGSNYSKLKAIKKKYDPRDVFWCHPCVGNEGWKEDGVKLCRI
jgi:hypothetical protein